MEKIDLKENHKPFKVQRGSELLSEILKQNREQNKYRINHILCSILNEKLDGKLVINEEFVAWLKSLRNEVEVRILFDDYDAGYSDALKKVLEVLDEKCAIILVV